MKSAAPRARSTRSGSRCPHSGDSGSGSVTSACSDRDQQRKLESCEPAEEKLRIKKKKHRPPPKFLKGLVRAVTDRSDVIAFKDGSVTIRNHRVLVKDVLSVFFKASTSLKSFLRQLNYFAFKKIGGKGTKEPGIFFNATLKGKDAGAILSLKRRQPGNLGDKSATRQSPRLPRSASSSVLALKAAALSATVASAACSLPTHKTKLPPPPMTRSAAASSASLPPPSKAIDTRSGIEVVPTKPEIRGYTTSDPRILAAGKNDCGMAIGNNWNSFDARGRGYNTSDTIRKFPVPIAARDGSSSAHRSGSLDGNGGGGGGRSSDGDSHLGPFAAKRKVGEHFDGGAAMKAGLISKRGCRYLSRYCSNLNGLGDSGFQGRAASGVGGRGDGGDAQAAVEGASRQLPGLVKTKLQQLSCAPLAVRAPHVVAGLGRNDRTTFAFGYDQGRVAGRAAGTPPSSRRCVLYAVLSRDGSGWREQPITPCAAPTACVEPLSACVQPGSGLQPEMAMAAVVAAATRSPGTGRFLLGGRAEKVGNTTPVVRRGTSMDTSIEGVGGGGGESCSWGGGNIIRSFDSTEMFGSFFAVEGDVSLDRLDECFMRERVWSPPGQEGLTEHGNGDIEFGAGLCHDY